MNWDRWIPEKFFVKSEVLAVNVHSGSKGITYHYTHLRKKKSKLESLGHSSGKEKLELPASTIKSKTPIVILLTGKTIICRKVLMDSWKNMDRVLLIKSQMPAIDLNQFYAQIYGLSPNSFFLCICRKEAVQEILDQVGESKGNIVKMLLGAPAISGLKPLWSNLLRFTIPGYEIEILNGELENIVTIDQEISEEKLQFGGLDVPTANLLSFSGALSYLLQLPLTLNADIELSLLESRHVEDNKLKVLAVSLISLLFFISIVNLLIFINLFEKSYRLGSELDLYQGKYEKINELLNTYQINKVLIENAGVVGENSFSEWADRIGQTVPKEIILKELNFNPKIENDNGIDSLISFKTKYILALGYCPKSFVVNEWVNYLKMQDFIRDVSLRRFTYSDEKRRPNFEIAIVTN